MSRSLLIDALRSPVRPTVSVEFFPPKDAEGGARMLKVAEKKRLRTEASLSTSKEVDRTLRALLVDLI
jgi:hypothetical protein